MDIDILGIDLAKRVFQLHGADRSGHALYRSKVMRDGFVEAVRSLRPRVVAMEACSSAHHWADAFGPWASRCGSSAHSTFRRS